jgi:hypothetical protein
MRDLFEASFKLPHENSDESLQDKTIFKSERGVTRLVSFKKSFETGLVENCKMVLKKYLFKIIALQFSNSNESGEN